MAKMSIAQLRERETLRLAERHEPNPGPEALREAHRLMNSYYRLSALMDRNLILSNTESTCNLKSTARSEDRAYNWYKRLSGEFTAFCGLSLRQYGHIPSIIDADGHHAVSTYWYD